jgi:hypothetical protein
LVGQAVPPAHLLCLNIVVDCPISSPMMSTSFSPGASSVRSLRSEERAHIPHPPTLSWLRIVLLTTLASAHSGCAIHALRRWWWRRFRSEKARDIGMSWRYCYEMDAWVVMPNHVHLLILPRVPVPAITRWLKSWTARQANQLFGRSGQPLLAG